MHFGRKEYSFHFSWMHTNVFLHAISGTTRFGLNLYMFFKLIKPTGLQSWSSISFIRSHPCHWKMITPDVDWDFHGNLPRMTRPVVAWGCPKYMEKKKKKETRKKLNEEKTGKGKIKRKMKGSCSSFVYLSSCWDVLIHVPLKINTIQYAAMLDYPSFETVSPIGEFQGPHKHPNSMQNALLKALLVL